MATRAADLLTITPQGLYCPAGDFHVDPTRPVPRALITHGHSDHARAGHDAVMAVRYGADFARSTQVAELGEVIRVGDVSTTFVPAGHVLGSAQIVIADLHSTVAMTPHAGVLVRLPTRARVGRRASSAISSACVSAFG